MYKNLNAFLQEYLSQGADERRGLENFMECESQEKIVALRTELTGLVRRPPPEEQLDKLIGTARKTRHGSYENWTRAMLLWMAAKKR